MNIQVNETYRITSDSHNYIVNESRMVDPTKSPNWAKREAEGADPTPKAKYFEVSYHGTLEGALKSIIDRQLKTSDATNIRELLDYLRKFKAEMDAVLSVN
jgi:hypothetical protein